ncbi:hypothetical protein KQX54_006686 [Cotesia glomerata]|uniref:Uncharacterized protein n=1 Tax=Cotesia glomerata TaxID=32391 RepID=A0AAV7IVA4_COTGL|nr:hypothetical protein KQX54_006686 [Cotesia glomerata]
MAGSEVLNCPLSVLGVQCPVGRVYYIVIPIPSGAGAALDVNRMSGLSTVGVSSHTKPLLCRWIGMSPLSRALFLLRGLNSPYRDHPLPLFLSSCFKSRVVYVHVVGLLFGPTCRRVPAPPGHTSDNRRLLHYPGTAAKRPGCLVPGTINTCRPDSQVAPINRCWSTQLTRIPTN